MGLFKRKPKFIAAVCPQCGGNLEMDANLQTAYCTKCGAHCLVEDVQVRKPKKETPLQAVIGFVERQQDIKRKDKVAKQQRKDEEKRKEEAQTKKYWWILAVITVALFAFAMVMAALE